MSDLGRLLSEATAYGDARAAEQKADDAVALAAVQAERDAIQADLDACKASHTDPTPVPPTPTTGPPAGAVVPSGSRTGATDATAAWNDVLRQGKVIDASGSDHPTWRIDGKLLAYPGSGIYTGSKANSTTCTIDLGFKGNGAIANHSFAKDSRGNLLDPIDGFSITGDGDVRHGATGSGDLLKLWGDDIELAGFTTSVFRGGRWMVSVGKILAHDLFVRSVPGAFSGVGGLRHCGGTGARFERLDMWAGDDVFQVVTGGAPQDPMFNQDARDVMFKDCIGKSYSARLMIVALQDAANDGSTTLGMTAVAEGVVFDNVTGFGGGSGVTVKNNGSIGRIADVAFRNGCWIDQSQTWDATRGAGGEVWLNKGGTGTGVLDGIDLSGLTVRNKRPTKRAYLADGIVADIRNVIPMAALG